jgi:hypothetical protein
MNYEFGHKINRIPAFLKDENPHSPKNRKRKPNKRQRKKNEQKPRFSVAEFQEEIFASFMQEIQNLNSEK